MAPFADEVTERKRREEKRKKRGKKRREIGKKRRKGDGREDKREVKV